MAVGRYQTKQFIWLYIASSLEGFMNAGELKKSAAFKTNSRQVGVKLTLVVFRTIISHEGGGIG